MKICPGNCSRKSLEQELIDLCEILGEDEIAKGVNEMPKRYLTREISHLRYELNHGYVLI